MILLEEMSNQSLLSSTYFVPFPRPWFTPDAPLPRMEEGVSDNFAVGFGR
jgi:hypothetical protein